MNNRERLIKFNLEGVYEDWKRREFSNLEDIDVILAGNLYSKRGTKRSRLSPTSPKIVAGSLYYEPEHIIQKGKRKHQILKKLSEGDATTQEIKRIGLTFHPNYSRGYIWDDQDTGMYLRRMEYADMVERPRRGLYHLTKKGKNVLKEVEEKGIWGYNKRWRE